MMMIAAGWIIILLSLGGVALDRILTSQIEAEFDNRLLIPLNSMLRSAEVDPEWGIRFNSILGNQSYLEPGSGSYWQISGEGYEPFPSNSLWDDRLVVRDVVALEPIFYDSVQFREETLRMAQRTVQLPGSDVQWQFVVAQDREVIDNQIRQVRSTLVWSFAILGIGLFLMAMAQTWYGLGPLRRVRQAIARIRTTGTNRVTEPLPLEVLPMVDELNALLAHSEKQAEEARTHAGNLAHALKTPLTVLNNAAHAKSPDLDDTVLREADVMQRHVDHHLARARAVGRRATGLSRANVLDSAQGVERAVSRLYQHVRFDIDGKPTDVAIERQDLDELLGNLIENAAKYGGGSVFITIDAEPKAKDCVIWIEDDGRGIPEKERDAIFGRGARLDMSKPGTGLGLAIVRDVAQIYGGEVALHESEDLGGLLVKLTLPRAG
ncbi:HAMP domain-containing sensor histidine kinase [Aurantiacibacter sp. D1-12]|uniref:HAMP domain-containing sensor histidine kinase n=1 Tax=Aurantiacibacter sp. D1-12 TaxID=2993658 RepID=UPI00237CFED4|nr:HAMP domain-containing sensor histidine kinase [Aurantiacibacter sp. D1-12]MDE1466418.1 HAMP domain-containing sensor histidine kinase [Aurantiacibacter sp. D1-12]